MKFGLLANRRRRSPHVNDDSVDRQMNVRPLYIVVDTSASMQGAPITWVNSGIVELFEIMKLDPILASEYRIALLSFDAEARVEMDSAAITEHHTVPVLVAGGPAKYVPVLDLLESTINRNVSEVQDSGIRCYRPLVLFITSGRPVDMWEDRFDEFVSQNNPHHPHVVPCGVAGAQRATVHRLMTHMYPVGPDDGAVVLLEDIIRLLQELVWLGHNAYWIPNQDVHFRVMTYLEKTYGEPWWSKYDTYGRPVPNRTELAAIDVSSKRAPRERLPLRLPVHPPVRLERANITLLEDIACAMNLEVDDLTGDCRQPEMARAQELAMHVVERQTGLDAGTISVLFRIRDQNAVRHALSKVRGQINRRPEVSEQVTDIIRKLDVE